MRVQISDSAALKAITPAQLMAYLRSRGAQKVDDFAGKATVWTYDTEELLVPLATHFADYASRMADILSSLELVENRSQMLIMEDLRNSGFDVIRVRNVSDDTRQGSLNFMNSVEFVSLTRDMMMAAACSASTHKISYPGRKPLNAEAFMETVRFGQTAQGSFILQLLAPVAPELMVQGKLIDVEEKLPYEKTVIPTLQSGLNALNSAAEQTCNDSDLKHFQNAVEQGLTTNLCDAITGLYEHLKPQYIEVAISYSANRRQQHKVATVSVDAGYIPIISEASKYIKEYDPETDQCVRGIVVTLSSNNPDTLGTIKIREFTDARPRLLTVQLAGDDYQKAVTAHKSLELVELTGTIKRFGHSWHIDNPSSLTIIEDRDL